MQYQIKRDQEREEIRKKEAVKKIKSIQATNEREEFLKMERYE